jgi:hypothetical protein
MPSGGFQPVGGIERCEYSKAEIPGEVGHRHRCAESFEQAPICQQDEQLQGAAFAPQLAVDTPENLDFGSRGDFDGHDTAIVRVAEQQPIAIKLVGNCLVTIHSRPLAVRFCIGADLSTTVK